MTEFKINTSSTPDERELELINKYTRRPYTAEEVYVFSLTLCDNDVDRDFERFTVEALFELEKLFVGKTGIIDHHNSSKNQTARVFECRVEAVEGRKTLSGDDYFRLTARAYIPVTEGNKEIIAGIDSGIKKEVSVGCAVRESVCSICSNRMGALGCSHTKGETYGDKLCFAELREPYDAYEWSFVAVPAQREAGVTKAFFNKGRSIENMESIEKMLELNKETVLSAAQCETLKAYIETLKKDAQAGREYRESLEKEFLRLVALTQPEVRESTARCAMSGMDTAQIKEFISAYSKKAEGVLPLRPQLAPGKADKKRDSENREYKI